MLKINITMIKKNTKIKSGEVSKLLIIRDIIIGWKAAVSDETISKKITRIIARLYGEK